MPSPREQPNPPGSGRRRPEPPASGSWLWLVLLLGLVLVLLLTVGMGSGVLVSYSDFMDIAREGADKATKTNKNFKQVAWAGDRLEGELLESANITGPTKDRLRGSKRIDLLPGVGTRIFASTKRSTASPTSTAAEVTRKESR